MKGFTEHKTMKPVWPEGPGEHNHPQLKTETVPTGCDRLGLLKKGTCAHAFP